MTDKQSKQMRQTAVQELKDITLKLANKSPIGVVRFHEVKNEYCRMKGVPPGMLHIEEGRWLNIAKQATEDGRYCYRITEVFWSNFGHHENEAELLVDLMSSGDDIISNCIPRPGKRNGGVGLRFPKKGSVSDPLLGMREGTSIKRLQGALNGFVDKARLLDENNLASPLHVAMANRYEALAAPERHETLAAPEDE